MLGRPLSYAILVLTPFFFSTNLIFGKVAVANIEPWTLAFLRWASVAIILLPFVGAALPATFKSLRGQGSFVFLMGFLGMWICGAIVYLALQYTSATNGTLIYLSSPVLIILIEGIFFGREFRAKEAIGIVLAFIGVAGIVSKGELTALLEETPNVGDLLFVACALSWAVYSVFLKDPVFSQHKGTIVLCLFSGAGAITLAPFAFVELTAVKTVPLEWPILLNVAGIVFSSSLIAFLGFQYSVRFAGATMAGVFMYLLPIYGVGLAVFLLGEEFRVFHALGIAFILSGVIVATFPTTLLRKKRE